MADTGYYFNYIRAIKAKEELYGDEICYLMEYWDKDERVEVFQIVRTLEEVVKLKKLGYKMREAL